MIRPTVGRITSIEVLILFPSCPPTAKPPLSSPALQRRHQDNRRKRSQPQTSSSSSSSSHPHPAPPSILLSDTTMTPWGGLALSESSFTSIPPPPPPPPPRPPQPPPPPPPPPPAPQPTPSTPYRGRQNEDEELSSFNSQAPSPPVAVPPDGAGMSGTVGSYSRLTVQPVLLLFLVLI